MLARPLPRLSFCDREDRKENNCETDTGNRSDLLGQKVDHTQCYKRQRDQTEPNRDFRIADFKIEGDTELALPAMFVSKHQYGKPFRCETPHHTERVGLAQYED